ncbi:MAG: glycosyltransferase family 4 protein [Pirellulaceae bacterium]|nr:glycosyltransferase family 4 protein [Pirellulaceae bacterium]
MRILILTTQTKGRGGIQYVGRLLLKALSDGLGRDAEIHAVSVHDHDQAPLENSGWTIHGGGGSRWRAAWLAARAMRQGPWDVLILGHLHLAPLLLTARRGRHWKAGLGLVYGLEAWQPLSRFRRLGIERLDQLVYISEHSRNAAYDVNPWLKAVPSAVCYLGLEPAGDELRGAGDGERGAGRRGQRSEVRGRRTEDGGTGTEVRAGDFALSIGRMTSGEAYKGHEEMIRVWPEVARRRPGFPLVIIGDGDDRPRLEQLAGQLGANVRFLGGVDDSTRDAHLSACRCFCLPSRGEGFGLVYLEAMREGKSVLAGNQDAGREVVVDGLTGRTVDARDAEQLLAGILDVSGERAEAMGSAGRQRYEAQFSYEVFKTRLLDHIAALTKQPSRITARG